MVNKTPCVGQRDPGAAWEQLGRGTAGLKLLLPWERRLHLGGQQDWGAMGDPIPNPRLPRKSHSLPPQHCPDTNAAAKARLILFKLRM